MTCRDCGGPLVRSADGIRIRHEHVPADGHAPRPVAE